MARPHVQRGVSLTAFTPDNYDLLDTARMLADIEAETGVTLFNNFSVLSPALQRKQMETGLGITLTNYSELSPVLLCAEVATATASDGAPEWVPANAKIYIDLIAPGRAWTEDDGEVAIDTLLGADANTVNGWDATSYDAGNLTADGYPGGRIGGSDVAFTNVALSSVLSGATIVVRSKVLDASAGITYPLVIVSADGNHAVQFSLGDHSEISTYDGPANVQQAIAGNSGAGALNASAVTYAVTRADMASNGQAAITTELTGPEVTGFVAAVCSIAYNAALQSITIYDALPSTAGLSELSRIIPEDAKIHINLVQDWAWTEADGFVAIDTLLGTDANTENAWGETLYEPAKLTADGYVISDTAFIGSARALMLAGMTVVVRSVRVNTDPGSGNSIAIVNAAGDNAVEYDQNNDINKARTYSWNNFAGAANTANGQNTGVIGATNVVAWTYAITRLDLAINGGDAVTVVVTDNLDDLVAALISVGGAEALQSITIYDALPSTAGLSALSATGVTNTAPHDITGEWATFNDDNTGSGLSATYQQHVFTDIGGGEAFYILTAQTATDAEGNPLTFTLTDDDSGLFDIGPVNQSVRLLADFPNTDPHSFTLRATDPGGLYVEQQFTITVTA